MEGMCFEFSYWMEYLIVAMCLVETLSVAAHVYVLIKMGKEGE